MGTDSNVRIALNEELRTLEYGQRLRAQKRNRLGPVGASTGLHLFDTARRSGAQALGLASGSIAIGRRADMVILDDAHPALVGRDGGQIVDSWIFAAGDGAVRDVFAGGQQVVAEARHVHRDEIRGRFTATMRRLLEDA